MSVADKVGSALLTEAAHAFCAVVGGCRERASHGFERGGNVFAGCGIDQLLGQLQ